MYSVARRESLTRLLLMGFLMRKTVHCRMTHVILRACLLLGVCAPAGWAIDVVPQGPYNILFYNNGETDGSATGWQNWTAQQKSDVSTSVLTWANSIGNAPGRQVELHMFWTNFTGNTLGSTFNPTVWNFDFETVWTRTEFVWREGVPYSAGTDVRISLHQRGHARTRPYVGVCDHVSVRL
jgi:hypothetical protein